VISLSVIIPSYNGRGKLPFLLEILQKIRKENDEIIVVDDASTDGTFELARQFSVRVFRQEINSGVGAARNRGAGEAKNDVLVFFDDDILPQEDYLEQVRKIFEDPSVFCAQGPHDLRALNAGVFPAVEAILWRYEMEFQQHKNGKCATLYSQSFCMRRDFFSETGGFREDYAGAGGEEFEYGLRLLQKDSIHFFPQLITQHHFQDFFPRLFTLYRRARHFPRLARAAGRTWHLSQVGHALRVLCSLILVSAFLAFFILPMAGFIFFISIIGFLILDLRLVIQIFRWKKWLYFPLVLLVRICQYLVMALALFRGVHVRRT
jgi:GT2 family glycosyltransferase